MQAARAQGKTTAVLGLGASGFSAVRHLHSRGEAVCAFDTREAPPFVRRLRSMAPETEIHLGAIGPDDLVGFQQIVVSPGVPVATEAVKHAASRGAEILGDVELFAREVSAPVIAVTGSNGKSTVTILVGEMAKAAGIDAAVGGNIGTPVLDLLDRDEEPALFVLELSSFQLETTSSLHVRAATVLNVTADHMDRYADVDDYARAKGRIFRHAQAQVINRDDPRSVALARPGVHTVSFGRAAPGQEHDYGLLREGETVWLCRGDQRLLETAELRVQGEHNWTNVLAALALGEAASLPMKSMLEAARAFTGLPHRSEWVANRAGMDWYNDSKATTVGATAAAVAVMPGRIVLIAGGEGKDADFDELRPLLAGKARGVVLIGRDAGRIARAIDGVAPIVFAESMEDAVARAADLGRQGDSVLLSPACASFDMFSGFEARGEAFRRAVQEEVR